MASILNGVLRRIRDVDSIDDKLEYAAEYTFLAQNMQNMLKAFLESRNSQEQDAALEYLEKSIAKLAMGLYKPTSSGGTSSV